METPAEQAPDAPAGATPDADHAKSRNRRSNQRRGPRHEDPVEERRGRPRSGDRGGANGFRDGLEHAFCEAMPFSPSPTGVINHRPGLATMVHVIVARRADAVLQCDLQHEGPHVWPGGEVAERTA